ncbi:MAG: potassium-transporting ATPase subunit KdpA [Cellulosilyticaceae bacterium]
MAWIYFGIVIIIFIFASMGMGKYLYKVIFKETYPGEKLFNSMDHAIYKLCGIKRESMGLKEYVIALVTTNIIIGIVGFVVLKLQGYLLLNPNGSGSLNSDLAFNTTISFMTNTNLQNYVGESALSHLSQMVVITFMMFTSAATGFAGASAFLRGIVGAKEGLGNFYEDLVRIITRVLLPVSIVGAIFLISQGVPQTLSGTKIVETINGNTQNIAMGPVASLEAIKHLGTNGGGFFGANSAHPFENPTPITNLIEMLLMMVLPGAFIVTLGEALKNKKQGRSIFVAALILFLVTIPIIFMAEQNMAPMVQQLGIDLNLGNMEGKEIRNGIAGSTLFSTVTTAFTTGSVNNMHDSLTPLGGIIPLWNMMLNVVFGGKGVGFMGLIMYAILTVFICGLMVGRTPEFLRKKVEAKEMKLIAIAILVHPILILISTAMACILPVAFNSVTTSGYHGLSQMLYQFTTSAANNGSGLEGLVDNTVFWNVSTGVVMLVGRYASMILLLGVAASLHRKTPVPEAAISLQTDKMLFSVILVFIIIVIGALTFLPALVLGPVAEHLTIW